MPPNTVPIPTPAVLSSQSSSQISTASTVTASSSTTATGATAQLSTIPTGVVQICSSLSLKPVQNIQLPPPNGSETRPVAPHSLRLLSSTFGAKSPLFVLAAPDEKAVMQSEGSTLWMLSMESWAGQVEELVKDGMYADALALLNTLDAAVLPEKV